MTKKIKKKTPAKKKPAVKKAKKPKLPSGMIQMTSPVDPDVSFYVAQEIADDKAIEQELLGAAVATMVYEFEQDGEMINGLSLSGVREVVRLLNRNPKSGHKIRISPNPPTITRDLEQGGQRGIEVMIYAEDLVTGSGMWGSKFEPYKKSDPNAQGSTYENKFAFEVALSKAQRNAMRSLLPETVINEMIELFKQQKGATETIVPAETETVEKKPIKTSTNLLYGSTIKRIEKIKKDKNSLQEALDNVDNSGLDDDQKKNVTKLLKKHLKALNKK